MSRDDEYEEGDWYEPDWPNSPGDGEESHQLTFVEVCRRKVKLDVLEIRKFTHSSSQWDWVYRCMFCRTELNPVWGVKDTNQFKFNCTDNCLMLAEFTGRSYSAWWGEGVKHDSQETSEVGEEGQGHQAPGGSRRV